MKKILCLVLVFILFSQNVLPVNADEISKEGARQIVLTLMSPFLESPIKKKAIIKDNEVFMDVGTLADLTGYECTKWGDIIIFDRGFRRIAVNRDGNVCYYYTDSDLQLKDVLIEDGYVYIPFSAGLKMLNSVELVADNKVYVVANNVSLIDNYNNSDMSFMVFDYDRDLPIKSVTSVKTGIVIATIFDKGLEYIINSASGKGPNANKYRDAAIYYMTYKNESTALSFVEEDCNTVGMVLDFFDDFGKLLVSEVESLPPCLYDRELQQSLISINQFGNAYGYIEPIINNLILFGKLKEVEVPQINSLESSINDQYIKFDNINRSRSSGVYDAVNMAKKNLYTYIETAGNEFVENIISDAGGTVLTGFNIGNAFMQSILKNEFVNMDDYDTIFCLKDMQDKTLRQYNECRERIWNGSTDKNDYIYAYRAMQFINNSNIAICQLLTEIFEERQNEKEVKKMLSYWKQRIAYSTNHYYASRITEEECIRDAVPADLYNVESKIGEENGELLIGNSQGNLNNGGFVAGYGNNVFLSQPSGTWHLNEEEGKLEKICESKLEYLNYSNGYLYGVEHDENELIYQLVRIKVCNKEKELLSQEERSADINEWDEEAHFYKMTLVGEYIYYISKNDTVWSFTNPYHYDYPPRQYTHNNSIFRIKNNGEEKKEIISDIGANADMVIWDNKICYHKAYSDGYIEGLFSAYYICDIDGENSKELVLPNENQPQILQYTVELAGNKQVINGVHCVNREILLNDNVICISSANGTGSDSNLLFSYPIENNDKMNGIKLLEQVYYTPSIIDDGYIYFCGTSGSDMYCVAPFHNFGLYKMDLRNPNSKEPLFTYPDDYSSVPGAPWSIGVLGDWIYFRGINYSSVPTSSIYRIKKNGSNLQIIEDGKISNTDKPAAGQTYMERSLPSKTTVTVEPEDMSRNIISEQEAVNLIIDNVEEPEGYWGLPYSCSGRINYSGEEYYLVNTSFGEQLLVSLDGSKYFKYK